MSNSRAPLVSLTVGLVWLSSAWGQAPRASDLLEQYKKQQEIASQKSEADVSLAVNEAQRLLAVDPAKAVEVLRRALAKVEADTGLTVARRDALARMLRERIRTGQIDAEKFAARGVDPRTAAAEGRAAADRQAADQERVNRTMQAIQVLQRDGKHAEAARMADELLKQYPNQLANLANARLTSTTDILAASRVARGDAGNRQVATLVGVDRAAIPPRGDVEFPADWKERVAKRTASPTPMTDREKSIMKALASPIDVNYKNDRFEDIIQSLSDKLGQPILLDRTSLEEAQVTTDSPYSLSIKNASARTILRKVLGDLGLTYIVKNEAIQVITPDRANKEMIAKTYYIGDLLQGGMFAQAGVRFNPWVDQFQAMQNVMSIIQMVETIEPGSWQKHGGQGGITFHAPSMSLVIKQTAELHNMLGSSLR